MSGQGLGVFSRLAVRSLIDGNEGHPLTDIAQSFGLPAAVNTSAFAENFEGGTNGTALSSSNTAYTASVAVSNATATFDSSTQVEAVLSAKLVQTASFGTAIMRTPNLTAPGSGTSVHYKRLCFKISALPSGNLYISQLLANGGGVVGRIRINSTGHLELIDNTTLAGTGSTVLTANVWYRLEWDLVGTIERVRLYADAASTTVIDRIDATVTGGVVLYSQDGIVASANSNLVTLWLDAVADDYTAQPGPVLLPNAWTQTADDPVGLSDSTSKVGPTYAQLAVSSADTSNTTSYTTPSFTPNGGDLLVALVYGMGTVATGSFSASAGVSFTKVTSTTAGSGADTVYAFVANQLVPNGTAPITTTFNCTGDAATGAMIVVVGISNVSKVGLTAIRQSAAQADQDSTVAAPVFGSAALTSSVILGVIGQEGAASNIATPPSGFTELIDSLSIATPTGAMEVAYKLSGFTGTTVTWGAAQGNAYGDLVLEVDTTGTGTAWTQTADDPVGLTGDFSTALTLGVTATDPVGLADSVSQAWSYVPSVTDPAGLADSTAPVSAFAPSSTDPAGLTDTTSAQPGPVRNDVVGLTDAASTVAAFGASASDSTGLTDRTSIQTQPVRTDPTGLTDSVAAQAVYSVTTTDVAVSTDTTSAFADKIGTASDPLTLADTTSSALFRVLAVTITDPTGLTDSEGGTFGSGTFGSGTFGAPVPVDSTQLAFSRASAVTDTTGLVDIALGAAAFSASASDPAGLTDSGLGSAGHVISTTDLVGLLDDSSAATSTGSTDPVGLRDSFGAAVGTGATDSTGLTDTSSRVLAYAPSVTDPVGLVDSVSRVWVYAPSSTDPVGLTDASSSVSAKAATASDPVGLTDAASAAAARAASATDTTGLSDTALPLVLAVTVTDPAVSSDSTDTVVSSAGNLTTADPVGLTDSTSTVGVVQRSASDTAGLADSSSLVLDHVASATDLAGLTDVASPVVGYAASTSDPVGLTDVTVLAEVMARSVTDPVGLTDVTTAGLAVDAGVTDPAGLTDTASVAFGYVGTATDLVGLAETTATASAYGPSQSDDVGLSDAYTALTSFTIMVQADDSAGLTDYRVSRLTELSADDLVGLADEFEITVLATATAVDSAGLGDQLSWAFDYVVEVTDGAGLADTIQFLGQMGYDRFFTIGGHVDGWTPGVHLDEWSTGGSGAPVILAGASAGEWETGAHSDGVMIGGSAHD